MERGQAVDARPIVQSQADAHAVPLDQDWPDTIAVFAPAGYDTESQRLVQATRYFESRGARVVPCLTVDGRHDRFAGDDAERLGWLRTVTDDPSIDIAMALRGGYGTTRLLPHIDFDAMAAAVRAGKRFVGHSDFTAVILGLLARAGAVGFAGPMASYDFGGASVDPFTALHFRRAMHESCVDVEFATPTHDPLQAKGVLWGGNLAMIASLIGTPWMPQVDDGILFVEDINEPPYRIERMLLQLHQAGILARQKVVLCGDFSGYRTTPYDHGYDIDSALAYVAGVTATPLVTGLPFGHCPQKLTLAVGVEADVRVASGRCRLRQRWDLTG